MKYTIEVTHTVKTVKVYDITADSEEQAREEALKMAVAGDDLYQTEENYSAVCVEVSNDYVDRQGCPYDPDDENHCWPAGGGLHKDCEFNADALYAYYTLGDREKIEKYLFSKGFLRVEYRDDWEQWVKGNTQIDYEDYDNSGHLWGYMHTELIDTD